MNIELGGEEFKKKLYVSPLYVQLDLTNKCNLNCVYCYNRNVKYSSELSDMQLLDLVSQIKEEVKPLFVTFSGGEPFVRKEIMFRLIKILKESDIEIFVNTNGTLIDESVAKKIGELDIDKININLDGIDKEKHDKLRGLPGCFDRALKAIELLKKHAPHTLVSIRTVITNENYEEIVHIAKFVRELGLKEYMLIDFIPKYDDQHLMMNKEEWLEFYKIYKKIKEIGLRIIPNHAILFLERKRDVGIPFCMAGRIKLSIGANGDAFACDHLKEKKFVAGNVLTEKILDIWQNSGVINKFRELEPIECKECNFVKQCGGGCHAMAHYIHKNVEGMDPYCKMGLENGE